MPNSTELLRLIKKAAIDAVEAAKPVHVVFGTVINTNPLEINVEQKLTLTTEQLILCEQVQNKIEQNKRVVLLRQQGGQNFIVLDCVIE